MERGIKDKERIEYYMQLPYSILLHEVEDEDEKYWIAEVTELPGCRSHGTTVEEAVRSVEEAKRDWILDSLERSEEVPVPAQREKYSGKTVVRMSRSLHRSLALIADAEGLSLNQLITTILAKEVGRLNVLNRVEEKVDNALEKINDVIEERKEPSSRFIRFMTEDVRDVIHSVGTVPDIDTQIGINVASYLRGAASTASPLEELQYSLPLKRWEWGGVVSSRIEIKEDDAVEIEVE